MKKILTIVVLLIGVQAYAQITEKDVVNHGSFKPGAFKNAPKRIFINSFNVYFQVFGSARASTTGGEMLGTLRGNTNVAMGVALDGVDSKDFLEITNEVYEQYVSKLKAMGYEIVSADEAGKTEAYSNWVRKEGGELSSTQSVGFLKVTPNNYAYYVKRETAKGKEKSGFVSNNHVLSKQLDDAVIADVNMTFYFVQMKTFDNEFLGYAQVTGKPNFHFARLLGDVNNQVLSSANYGFGKNLTAHEAAINTTLKKGVWSEQPVFDNSTKFKEAAAAASRPIPSYAAIVFVNHVNMNTSHYLECDTELYKKETKRMMIEFLDISLDRLKANIK
ncbi:MAG: hypothetical protein KF845_10705 [Cyclobacteriaceae bacterium]|nr:hypothetical protein [Cyclobacteriaceae bacterium]